MCCIKCVTCVIKVEFVRQCKEWDQDRAKPCLMNLLRLPVLLLFFHIASFSCNPQHDSEQIIFSTQYIKTFFYSALQNQNLMWHCHKVINYLHNYFLYRLKVRALYLIKNFIMISFSSWFFAWNVKSSMLLNY